MSFAYTYGKTKVMSGDIDLNTDDIRLLMVMSNTTADTEEDKEFVGDFTTLDEMDGANYVRKALANEAVAADLANDRGEMDADDVTWAALGVGTRQVVGIVVYRHVTNDADSPAIAYIDDGGFPFSPGGGDVLFQINVEGLLQIT